MGLDVDDTIAEVLTNTLTRLPGDHRTLTRQIAGHELQHDLLPASGGLRLGGVDQ